MCSVGIAPFLFSILIFILGTSTRYSQPFIRSLTVLSDENSRENENSETIYTSIQAPFNSSYEVSINPAYHVTSLMEEYYWGSGTQNGTVNAKRVVSFDFSKEQTLLSLENLTAFSSRCFALGNNISEINRLKNFRRKLKTIKFAIEERCSAAAYGESQAGKSYLMDSLLSQIGKPFSVDFGKEKPVFVDEINPSGGKNVKRESTGVITRFTTRCNNSMMTEYVKVRNFTIVDIILFLSDSYYKDIKIHPETALDLNDLNKEIEKTLNLNLPWRCRG